MVSIFFECEPRKLGQIALKSAEGILKKNLTRISIVIVIVVAVLLFAFIQFPIFRTSSAQSDLNTGIIIPMFSVNYSQAQVNEVIQAKVANPTVPFIVVVNHGNGPGSSYDSQYAAGIKTMQTAGIIVLGYDPTGWGERNVSSIEKDMLTFHNWYHVDGIYLDQMVNWEFNSHGMYLAPYYANLTQYAHSLGMTKVLGNSGADVPYYFVGTVDQIGIFENAFTPPLQYLAGWHLSYNKTNFWFVSYNVSSPNPYFVASASDYVNYLYLTNGEHPYPYGDLPPYFNELVSDLAHLAPLTIKSESFNGSAINSGFLVTVTQPDGLSDTMFTPSTFNVYRGSKIG